MQTFKTAKQNQKLIAKNVFRLIKNEMALVEDELERQTTSNVQVVKYLGDYLRVSGGKRLRPALLILSYSALRNRQSSENVIRLATVMEMFHTATLVHDDIIDNAATRRSQTSVNAKFGNQAAVLMGDWLYMSAFETSLEERDLEILDILTEMTRKMTEGELMQLTMLGRTDITEVEYFDILQRKTAFLFSACCEIGAILGGASKEQRSALGDYGKNLGISFQLVDDLLDFTADKDVLGKASGADLLEGKLTLPLILLRDKEPSIIGELEAIIRDGEYVGNGREELIKRLTSTDTLKEVKQAAYNFSEKAKKNLEILGENEYRRAMVEISSYITQRTR